jgi:hypothetical protein
MRCIAIGCSMGVALLTMSCAFAPPHEPPTARATCEGPSHAGASREGYEIHPGVQVDPALLADRGYVIILVGAARGEPPIVLVQPASSGALGRLATPSSRPFKPSPYEDTPPRARLIDEDSPYP